MKLGKHVAISARVVATDIPLVGGSHTKGSQAEVRGRGSLLSSWQGVNVRSFIKGEGGNGVSNLIPHYRLRYGALPVVVADPSSAATAGQCGARPFVLRGRVCLLSGSDSSACGVGVYCGTHTNMACEVEPEFDNENFARLPVFMA